MGPRAGLDECEKPPPPTGIRSPDRSARSKSLYRLSYPGPPASVCRAIKWLRMRFVGLCYTEKQEMHKCIHNFCCKTSGGNLLQRLKQVKVAINVALKVRSILNWE